MKKLLLLVLLVARAAWADPPVNVLDAPPPAAPVRGPVAPQVSPAVEPLAPVAPPRPPTLTEVVLCTAETLPGTVGKCAGLPTSPRMDDRAFYTTLFGTIGATITVAGGLITLYLNPPPVR